MRRWLAAIVLALCIQGCVPAPVKYWSPTAGGAKVVNTNCGTAAAPASTLEYSLGDVLMHVEGKDNHAKLQLMVPAGSRVHLQEAEAYIRVSGMDGKKIPISVASFYDFTRNSSFRQSPLKSMEGETRQHAFGTENRSYSMILEYPQIQGNEFSITLPVIIVNGRAFSTSTISFTKKTGFGLMPINC